MSRLNWNDPEEFHLLVENLSGANRVIWVDPYNRINGSIMPKTYNYKEGLTIYNPGMNFLPLQMFSGFNEMRRSLQIKLFLIEKDFEPDIVMVDSPFGYRIASHFKGKGVYTVYYSTERDRDLFSLDERRRLESLVDLTYKAELIKEETDEEKFLALLNQRLDKICTLIEKSNNNSRAQG